MTCLLDLFEVNRPSVIHPTRFVFQRFLGRRRSGERLRKTFELADPEHVDCHTQPVERLAVVVAISTEPAQEHRAKRVQVDLVGVGGKKVLALIERRTPRDHRLAGFARSSQSRCHLVQSGKAGTLEVIQQQQDRRDLGILGRRVDCIEEVAQLGFTAPITQGFGQHRLGRSSGVLLHDAPAQ
jgi:hypothetical protein